MLTKLFTIIGGFLFVTLIEYGVHKFYLHSFNSHKNSQAHHKKFEPKKIKFRDSQADPEDILAAGDYIIFQIIFSIPIIALLWLANKFSALLILATAIAYISWVEVIHLHFHYPTGSNIEKLDLFKTLQWHHKIHHRSQQTNFGVGTSLWDYIFSTKQNRN